MVKMKTNTYRLTVFTKDSYKADNIVESFESHDFATISTQDVSVGTIYEIASNSKKITMLKRKLKLSKIEFTISKKYPFSKN